MTTNAESTTPSGLPSGAELAADLTDTRWRAVAVVATTGSTNADLIAQLGAAGTTAVELLDTVRLTDHQSAGRGRHSRVWEAPAGAQLATSAVVGVAAETTSKLGWLSLLTGLATCDAVEEVTGAAAALKWPNDVLVDGKKVSGILSEYVPLAAGDVVGAAVIGTGINTNATAADLPVPTATSLRILRGAPVDPGIVALAYLRALSRWVSDWPGDIDGLIGAYRQRSDTIGRRVTLSLPDGTEQIGEAIDIDGDGRIIVAAETGGRIAAAAGDVTHLRAVHD